MQMLLKGIGVMMLGIQVLPLHAARPAWETETWAPVRELVWSGGNGDWNEAEKWQEKGKPATTPPDQNTDVVVPSGTVTFKGNQSVRHLRVASGAQVRSNWDNYLFVWGNVDVEGNGRAFQLAFRGPKHAYLKAPGATLPPGAGKDTANIAHKLQIQKYGGASVEFIGDFHVTDEVLVQSGRLVLNGRLMYVSTTQKGAFEVFDGATLELQSGALLTPGRHTNSKNAFHLSVYRNGTLQAGSAERPLERDATIALGFNSNEKPGMSGLYAAEGSHLLVHSKDPSRARLVFTSAGAIRGLSNGKGESLEQKGQARGSEGIFLQIAGTFQPNGVHFDYLGEGALGLLDPSVVRSWNKVSLGPNNAASTLARLAAPMAVRPDQYVTDRWYPDDYKETTQVAMADYESFLAENDPYKLSAEPAATEMRKDKDGLVKPMTVEFKNRVSVKLQTALSGAEILYTLDGSEPVRGNAAARTYSGPLELKTTTRLRARAFHKAHEDGPEFSATYIVR